MRLARFFTVRRGLTFIILLLAGFIQALMLVVLTSSLDKRAAGHELRIASGVADLLTEAANHWAQERDLRAAAISGNPQAHTRFIEAGRQGDGSLELARISLDRSPGLELKALLLAEVESAHDQVIKWRAQDEFKGGDLVSYTSQGHPGSAFDAYTHLIEKAGLLVTELLVIGEELEPAASLVRLRGALWTASELAWQEAAIRGAPSSLGGARSRATLERLGRIQGRRQEAWKNAEAIAEKLPGASLAEAIARARIASSDNGESFDEAALMNLRLAQLAAGEATTKAAKELAEVSTGAIRLGYTLLGGAMLGSILALAMIHFGLYRPLRRLADAAVRIGEEAAEPVEIPSHRRVDEVGSLARGLAALQGRLGSSPSP